MLKYVQGAVMREPSLRESSVEWWRKQRTLGQWAREDKVVQNAAEKLGCGYVEGLGEAALLPKVRNIAELMLTRADTKVNPNARSPPLEVK